MGAAAFWEVVGLGAGAAMLAERLCAAVGGTARLGDLPGLLAAALLVAVHSVHEYQVTALWVCLAAGGFGAFGAF